MRNVKRNAFAKSREGALRRSEIKRALRAAGISVRADDSTANLEKRFKTVFGAPFPKHRKKNPRKRRPHDVDARIDALENEIGRILQMSPKDRAKHGFDLKLKLFAKELNALERLKRRRRGSRGKQNPAALLSALTEGAGFAAGERAFSQLGRTRRNKKGKPKKKPAARHRNSRPGAAAVSVGAGRRKLIFAGPKQKVTRLAHQLRAALGPGRVRSGRLGKKKGSSKKNPGIGTVADALIFAGVFKGMDILTHGGRH